MNGYFEPLKVQSLKEACVSRLESLILSGEIKIGERLPPERLFASRIGVSRPVLHEALVDLDAKGLVRIIPRRGVFVSDYRRSGSMAILASLLTYHDGRMEPELTQSLIDMRQLVETETARLAAAHRTREQLEEFRNLLSEEREAEGRDAEVLTELDFSFHLSVAVSSRNLVYPLIINSFHGIYTHLTGEFFRQYLGTPVIQSVHRFHEKIIDAFEHRDGNAAARTMTAMLEHGEKYLKGERP